MTSLSTDVSATTLLCSGAQTAQVAGAAPPLRTALGVLLSSQMMVLSCRSSANLTGEKRFLSAVSIYVFLMNKVERHFIRLGAICVSFIPHWGHLLMTRKYCHQVIVSILLCL